MGYCSMKYWYSGMNLGKAWAIATAFDMYLECAEGTVDPAWKVDKPVTYYQFREQLATQKLRYTPADRRYPGDDEMHNATKKPKHKRKPKQGSLVGSPVVATPAAKRA